MTKHFTKREIDEIEQALIERSKKDTSFPEAESLSGDELIPIVQDGENRRTTYSALEGKVIEDAKEYVDSQLDTKVDKVPGKGLSTEDYTTEEKRKLAGIEAGAEVNVNADWDASSGDAQILNKPDLSVYATKASVEDIEALIPSQASSSNQLADKDFVNSTVSTNTADFKGTFNSTEDLEQVTANNNDYAFVVSTDASGNTVYNRYKYTESTDSWLFEYALNNSSFTAAQWAAIQSGITSNLVTKLSALPTATELNNSLNNKVDKISGKGLSTNDYTTEEKNKLAGIESGAQVNKIEHITVDGVEKTITDKTVALSAKADDFNTEVKEDQEFLYRQTADGELNWVPSTAGIEKLKGKTLAWNQLVSRLALYSGVYKGLTVTNNGDGTYTFNGTTTATFDYWVADANVLAGHKYFVRLDVPNVHANFAQASFTLDANGRAITTPASDKTRLYLTIGSGVILNNLRVTPQVIDLTLLFNGNVPENFTVADFESMFPLSYYDYNPGTLLSFNGHYLKTVGFNLWDEEWEPHRYDPSTGGEDNINPGIRSKNYIPVIPNATYYGYVGTGGSIWFLEYDGNKNYLGIYTDIRGHTKTVSANTRFIRFYYPQSIEIYNHNICINLSNASRNGQYEPYKETLVKTNPTELTSSGVQIFPYGLCSAGNVYDEVIGNRAIKRVGRVDLGSLSWSKINDYRFFAQVSGAKVGISRVNFIAPLKYDKAVGGTTIVSGNMGFGESNDYFYISDSNYQASTAAQFASAMSGVYLYYELATPIVYDLDEPLDLKTVVDINGTEQVYPENTSTPYTAPIRADIQYGLKSSQLLTELRIADSLRFERDFTVTDYSGDHSGESVGFDGSEDATLALPEVINGQVERNTEISRTEEFHYQPVPVEHFNDAYKVDRIYGKTLVWDQLAETNGPLSLVATTDMIYYGVVGGLTKPVSIPSGHKYYMAADVNRTISGDDAISVGLGAALTYINLEQGESNGRKSAIATADSNLTSSSFYYNNYSSKRGLTAGDSIEINNIVVHDLTLMFGSGNEPTTVAEFESLFPLSYYPYDAGSLISNDAEAMESVGFNQWDEEWESGRYDTTTGEDVADTGLHRSKHMLPVLPNTAYYAMIYVGTSTALWMFFYDAGNNLITGLQNIGRISSGNAHDVNGYVFTTPSNCHYVKFYLKYDSSACINLSDPAKNGTYEPYRKSVMQLGLDSIKVKSHNIWDEEWEVGSIDDTTGLPLSSTNTFRSKNFIPIIIGAKYYVKCAVENAVLSYYYDANYNFIGYLSGANTTNRVPTFPLGSAYMKIASRDYYGPTYNNDICINVSSSFNGQYEPHGVLTMTGGLGGNDAWVDEIVGNKYIKRTFDEDLGNKTWQKVSSESAYGGYFFMAPASKSKAGWHSHVIATRFVAIDGLDAGKDNTISINSTPRYCIQCSSYATAEAFKDAMNGVHAIYELATPIEYELTEPMLDSGWIDENGTMRVVYEDESAPHVLFKSDITYGVNAGHIIDKANEIIKSFKEKLETLWDAVFNNS